MYTYQYDSGELFWVEGVLCLHLRAIWNQPSACSKSMTCIATCNGAGENGVSYYMYLISILVCACGFPCMHMQPVPPSLPSQGKFTLTNGDGVEEFCV